MKLNKLLSVLLLLVNTSASSPDEVQRNPGMVTVVYPGFRFASSGLLAYLVKTAQGYWGGYRIGEFYKQIPSFVQGFAY